MTFVVCRIIGNELLPRDEAGMKLAALRYIISQEAGINRIWIINHLHEPHYRECVLELLHQGGQRYHEIRFDHAFYRSLTTRRDKIRYAININGARNMAIELARREHDFVACIDQDCFFTARLWRETIGFITCDQLTSPRRQYYGLMMKRLVDFETAPVESLPNDEPQLVFRRDAPSIFDPELPFGCGDKMTLLHRLGYGPSPDYALSGDLCRTAGCVYHLRTGSVDAESQLSHRICSRALSIELLLRRLDSRC